MEAAIRDTMGQTYYDLGLYTEALTQWHRALDLHRQALGATNAKTVKIMSRVGNVYIFRGRFQDAEALLNQALAVQRRTLGPEHRDTL